MDHIEVKRFDPTPLPPAPHRPQLTDQQKKLYRLALFFNGRDSDFMDIVDLQDTETMRLIKEDLGNVHTGQDFLRHIMENYDLCSLDKPFDTDFKSLTTGQVIEALADYILSGKASNAPKPTVTVNAQE